MLLQQSELVKHGFSQLHIQGPRPQNSRGWILLVYWGRKRASDTLLRLAGGIISNFFVLVKHKMNFVNFYYSETMQTAKSGAWTRLLGLFVREQKILNSLIKRLSMEEESPTIPYVLLRNFRAHQPRSTSQGQISKCEYKAPTSVKCPDVRLAISYSMSSPTIWLKPVSPSAWTNPCLSRVHV